MRSFEEYWNEHWDVYAMEVAEKVWDYQQSKIDELTLQIAEMKSRLNDAYTDGQSAMYAARQSKVDELQKRVDAAKYYMKNIFSGDAEVDQCHLGDLLDILDGKIVDEIEQALKGGSDASN